MSITIRITLLGWLVTLVTLAVFVNIIVPREKSEFELGLESKAKRVAGSMRGVAEGLAASGNYSALMEPVIPVLSGDPAIEYVVVNRNDGLSMVIDRKGLKAAHASPTGPPAWKIQKLGGEWRPAGRGATSFIGPSKLLGRRVFQYSAPFDYGGAQGGWIHVGLSLNAYTESVRRTYKSTAEMALLCGALSLVISLLYAARLVRPIHILHSAVEKVAHGDLHARAEVHSRDEIEALAVAFNDMARTILGRNQILESVSFAAKRFLSDADQDTVVGEVLARVAQAAGATRGYVLAWGPGGGGAPVLQRQWQRDWLEDAAPEAGEGWQHFPWGAEIAQPWVEKLKAGEIVTATFSHLEKPLTGSIDSRIRSSIFVPVVVSGEWWGIVGFDDFFQERQWGEAERGSLRAVADMLGASVARHQVRKALVEAKDTLEQRVVERTRELQEQIEAKDRAHADLAAAQQRLIQLSRSAGMAEIATGVLHNVGNVLNSVNVSASLVSGKMRESRVDKMVAVIEVLKEHADNLPSFLSNDPKGQRVLPYLAKLGGHFQSERLSILTELESLSSHVGHIKQIVATQQSYAKVSGVVENIHLSSLVEDALRIVEDGFARHGVRVERDFEALPMIAADKHNILQILLNLVRNAKQARKPENSGAGHVIRIRIRRLGESRLSLSVQDNGIGLPPENLTRIFGHGFTTKENGHGFGLHSCALAAKQMGGSLRAESDGPGRGATFVLELPLKAVDDTSKKGAYANAGAA